MGLWGDVIMVIQMMGMGKTEAIHVITSFTVLAWKGFGRSKVFRMDLDNSHLDTCLY
jgi:hypothetical protein